MRSTVATAPVLQAGSCGGSAAFEERSTCSSARRAWGTTHRYAGDEAIAAGVRARRRDDDRITRTHRGHGHRIAKRADLGKMFAELLGRETGYCRGRGGSMHIADTSKGNLGANGIVGGGIPIATARPSPHASSGRTRWRSRSSVTAP